MSKFGNSIFIIKIKFVGDVDTGMFPASMRKSPHSLSILSETRVIDWLIRLIDRSPSNFWRNVVRNRIYLRRNLPAHLRSILLDKVRNGYIYSIEGGLQR